jgi:hypothetical protein
MKLIDLKRTTRAFFFAMDHGANLLREEHRKARIIFLKDSVFLTSNSIGKSKFSRELALDVQTASFGGHTESVESSKKSGGRSKRTLSSHKRRPSSKIVKSRTPD